MYQFIRKAIESISRGNLFKISFDIRKTKQGYYILHSCLIKIIYYT